MALAYRSKGTLVTKNSTANGTLILNEPSGSTTNDLIIACISFRGATIPSIPADWSIAVRTQVTGNTFANNNGIGSGLIAYIKRGATAPSYTFGSVSGQQFPNLAFGATFSITGQDLTNPLCATFNYTAPSSVLDLPNLAGPASYDSPGPYLHIGLACGGQETQWASINFGTNSITSFIPSPGETTATSTSGADGSIYIEGMFTIDEINSNGEGLDVLGSVFNDFGGAVVDNRVSARHSALVASFTEPRPPATGYSFSSFF